VTYDYTITDAHKPDRPKPRLTVRGLLKRRRVDATSPATGARPAQRRRGRGGDRVGLRREAAFRFSVAEARVHPIQAWVQIPDGLADDPGGLAEFIDHRLLVRIATGRTRRSPSARTDCSRIRSSPAALPGRVCRRDPGGLRPDRADRIHRACDDHQPYDFYLRLVGRGGLLADLADNGT